MKGRNLIIVISILFTILTVNGASKAQAKHSKPNTQRARIEITEQGYSPENVRLRRDIPARMTFVRLTDRTCGTEVVIKDFDINRPLPLNQPVTVSFTPKRSGSIVFTCGMDMMRGKLIVR